ncbi:MFS transporter [Bacillus sp. Soil768D1]|nr:MFS transporter [Bacillus sp. Soil768D1]
MSSLLKNKQFILLWLSEVTVSLGFSIFFLSVSWFTVQVLNLPGALGIVMTAVSLPRVLTMILGGVLADRMQKSKLMFITNLGQAILMVVMVSLYLNDGLTLGVLLLISALFGFLDAFFYPAISSLVPYIVKSSDMQRANSVLQGSTELTFVIGPFLAGALLTIGDFTLTFSVSAILILIASILVFPPWIKDQKPNNQSALTFRNIFGDLKEGILYIKGSPIHRSGTLSISIVNLLLMGPIIMSIPIIVSSKNGTPFDLSMIEGGLAVGTFLASILFLLWNRQKKRGKLVFIALFCSFFFLFSFSQTENIWLLATFAGMSGLMMMMVHLPTVTMVQEVTEKDKLGRVMSLISMAANGLEPIAFSILSILVALSFSIHSLLAGVSIIGILASLLLYLKSKEFRGLN